MTLEELKSYDAYVERAAILEYDAGFSREDAERRAGQMHPGPWTKAPEQLTLPKVGPHREAPTHE